VGSGVGSGGDVVVSRLVLVVVSGVGGRASCVVAVVVVVICSGSGDAQVTWEGNGEGNRGA
jgi:glucose-6-phosphate isomerase